MKNILSIDLDYISDVYLGNSFKGYLGTSLVSEKYWDVAVEACRPNASDLVENRKNVREVFRAFLDSRAGNTKVVFGIHHDSIRNHIPKEAEDLNIVNIDHHHDLGYSRVQDIQSSLGVNNEANWVSAISDQISDYTWVKNSSSFTEGHTPPLGFNIYEKESANDVDIKGTKWDLVFVCLSPNYTYDTHWIYFYLLIDVYESQTGNKVVIDHSRSSEQDFSKI